RATFFAIMGAFPTGVAIVTTMDNHNQPKGLTSNALCSVSAEPPLLLVCVDKNSNTLPALRHSQKFVVNYLSAGRGDLANLLAPSISEGPRGEQQVSGTLSSEGQRGAQSPPQVRHQGRYVSATDAGEGFDARLNLDSVLLGMIDEERVDQLLDRHRPASRMLA